MHKINITIHSKLTDKLKSIDNSINDDAFADLLDLPEDIQDDIDEEFIVTPWRYLFAQINDSYVGRVILDKREIEVNNKRYEIVGINGLAVRSSNQKQGIGKKLMNEAIVLCRKEGIDAIFLNAGEELHEYYKKFEFVMRSYDFIGQSGKVYLEDDGMILILNEDAEEILLSNKFNIGKGNV